MYMNICLSNKYNKYIPSRNTQSLFKIEVLAIASYSNHE